MCVKASAIGPKNFSRTGRRTGSKRCQAERPAWTLHFLIPWQRLRTVQACFPMTGLRQSGKSPMWAGISAGVRVSATRNPANRGAPLKFCRPGKPGWLACEASLVLNFHVATLVLILISDVSVRCTGHLSAISAIWNAVPALPADELNVAQCGQDACLGFTIGAVRRNFGCRSGVTRSSGQPLRRIHGTVMDVQALARPAGVVGSDRCPLRLATARQRRNVGVNL